MQKKNCYFFINTYEIYNSGFTKIKVKYYKPEEYMNLKKKLVLLIFKSLD